MVSFEVCSRENIPSIPTHVQPGNLRNWQQAHTDVELALFRHYEHHHYSLLSNSRLSGPPYNPDQPEPTPSDNQGLWGSGVDIFPQRSHTYRGRRMPMGVTSNWCHPQGYHARRPPTTVPHVYTRPASFTLSSDKQPWYWLCRINVFLSSIEYGWNHVCHHSIISGMIEICICIYEWVGQHLAEYSMGLLPDTWRYGLPMLRKCWERFPCHCHCRLATPTCITTRAWRTCRDACRDR